MQILVLGVLIDTMVHWPHIGYSVDVPGVREVLRETRPSDSAGFTKEKMAEIIKLRQSALQYCQYNEAVTPSRRLSATPSLSPVLLHEVVQEALDLHSFVLSSRHGDQLVNTDKPGRVKEGRHSSLSSVCFLLSAAISNILPRAVRLWRILCTTKTFGMRLSI